MFYGGHCELFHRVEYVTDMLFAVVTIPCSWHLPWFITVFSTMVCRRVLLLKQKLFSLLEYMSSTPVLSGVGVTQCFVFCVVFIDYCLSFFFWDYCIVRPS